MPPSPEPGTTDVDTVTDDEDWPPPQPEARVAALSTPTPVEPKPAAPSTAHIAQPQGGTSAQTPAQATHGSCGRTAGCRCDTIPTPQDRGRSTPYRCPVVDCSNTSTGKTAFRAHLERAHSNIAWHSACIQAVGLTQCPQCHAILGRLNRTHVDACQCRLPFPASQRAATADTPAAPHAPSQPSATTSTTPSAAQAPVHCWDEVVPRIAMALAELDHGWTAVTMNTTIRTNAQMPGSKAFKDDFAALLTAACTFIDTAPSDDIRRGALHTLFAIPKMLFGWRPGGRPPTKATMRQRLQLLCEGRVRELDILAPTAAPLPETRPTHRPRGHKEDATVSEAAKRAMALAQVGELHRAMQALVSQLQLPTLTPDARARILAQIEALHPAPHGPDGLPPPPHRDPSAPATPIFSVSALVEAVRRAPRKSAPGASGWRAEHLQHAMPPGTAASPLAKALHTALLRLTQGGLPDGCHLDGIYGGVLTPLTKPNGGLRPIVVGDVLLRIAGRAITHAYGERFATFFGPAHQFGIATPAGTETITHAIRTALAAHPDWMVLQLDMKNAYNTVERSFIAEELLKAPQFADLIPYFYARYGKSKVLSVPLMGEDACVESQRGVQQGDPLGPFFFCLALRALTLEDPPAPQPTDAMAQADDTPLGSSSRVLQLYLLDDGTICGPPQEVAAVARRIAERNTTLGAGLEFNSDKCVAWSPTLSEEARRAALELSFPEPLSGLDPAKVKCPPCETGGIVLLGAPVGTDKFCADHLAQQHTATQADLIALRQVPSTQIQLLLLRLCLANRPNHIFRTTPPSLTADFAQQHDGMVRAAVYLLQGFSCDTPLWQGIIHQPRRNGGLGIACATRVAPLAFVASVADASKLMLSSRASSFTAIREDVLAWLDTEDAFPGPAATDLHTALALFNSQLTAHRVERDIFHSTWVEDPRKLPTTAIQLRDCDRQLQHRLSTVAADIAADRMWERESIAVRARLGSQQQKHGSAILEAIPTTAHTTASNEAISAFLRSYSCVDVTSETAFNPALCAPHHYEELCPAGDGHRAHHDACMPTLVKLIQSVGATVEQQWQQPTRGERSTEPQIDLIAHDIEPHTTIGVEFSITSVLASDAIGRAATTPLHAAHIQERAKQVKYEESARTEGIPTVPLVFESTGTQGQKFQSFLALLEARAGPEWMERTAAERSYTARTFRQWATQLLAVAFWTGAARKRRAHRRAHERQPHSATPATPVAHQAMTPGFHGAAPTAQHPGRAQRPAMPPPLLVPPPQAPPPLVPPQ